ncbi:MAG: DUF916 and DUF3324 domain-containing protein [Streptococcaceae bacterium]|nr:DUF916 and DUF3324 domain-containing protein [Streptococcaceae bacterium]
MIAIHIGLGLGAFLLMILFFVVNIRQTTGTEKVIRVSRQTSRLPVNRKVNPKLVKASPAAFGVTVMPSDFQINPKLSYYDLLVKPKQALALAVTIQNSSDEPATFSLALNTAGTNDNGIIDYTSEQLPSLPAGYLRDTPVLADIARLEQDMVTVLPKGSVTVPIKIQMPDQSFKGMILGAIHVLKLADDRSAGQAGLSNRYAVVKGVVIRESLEQVPPKLILNALDYQKQADQLMIQAQLINANASHIAHLSLKVTVIEQATGQVVSRQDSQALEMAPNSSFKYRFAVASSRRLKGDYRLAITASDQAGHSWQLEKELTVVGD